MGVVLGDTNSVPGVSYFVASGRCFIVRRVKMLELAKQTANQKQECFYRLQPSFKPKKTWVPCPKTPNKITARKTTTQHKQISEWFKQNDNQKKVEKFLVCGVLESGDSFGFGEDLRSIYIITATSTKFITIPTHVLMTEERHVAEHARSSKIEHSKNELIDTLDICSEHFKELKSNIERKIPSEQMTFQSWMTARRWNSYKQEIMLDIIESRKSK